MRSECEISQPLRVPVIVAVGRWPYIFKQLREASASVEDQGFAELFEKALKEDKK